MCITWVSQSLEDWQHPHPFPLRRTSWALWSPSCPSSPASTPYCHRMSDTSGQGTSPQALLSPFLSCAGDSTQASIAWDSQMHVLLGCLLGLPYAHQPLAPINRGCECCASRQLLSSFCPSSSLSFGSQILPHKDCLETKNTWTLGSSVGKLRQFRNKKHSLTPKGSNEEEMPIVTSNWYLSTTWTTKPRGKAGSPHFPSCWRGMSSAWLPLPRVQSCLQVPHGSVQEGCEVWDKGPAGLTLCLTRHKVPSAQRTPTNEQHCPECKQAGKGSVFKASTLHFNEDFFPPKKF